MHKPNEGTNGHDQYEANGRDPKHSDGKHLSGRRYPLGQTQSCRAVIHLGYANFWAYVSERTSLATGFHRRTYALTVNYQVHVKRSASAGSNSGLKCIVKFSTPVDCHTRDDAGTLQNPKSVAVDRKDVTLKTVE
jgi:hypothetical protein